MVMIIFVSINFNFPNKWKNNSVWKKLVVRLSLSARLIIFLNSIQTIWEKYPYMR